VNKGPAQLASLVDIGDGRLVLDEIRTIVRLARPDFDFTHVDAAANDVIRLFAGTYPGFRACNLRYHDLTHTLAVTLAVTRLLHGAVEAGQSLSARDWNIGLISALMHDTGYIQRDGDTTGTGAKYTLTHIGRSIAFINEYYRDHPAFKSDLQTFQDILECTGVYTCIADIHFENKNTALLGRILGTGDLLGQMSDPRYLEKLPDLYNEFVEGGISAFTSTLDLLQKTLPFYQATLTRFEEDLGGAHHFARPHFRKRWGIDADLYAQAMEENMTRLEEILTHHQEDFLRVLGRNVS
jgi:hypothetical protein